MSVYNNNNNNLQQPGMAAQPGMQQPGMATQGQPGIAGMDQHVGHHAMATGAMNEPVSGTHTGAGPVGGAMAGAPGTTTTTTTTTHHHAPQQEMQQPMQQQPMQQQQQPMQQGGMGGAQLHIIAQDLRNMLVTGTAGEPLYKVSTFFDTHHREVTQVTNAAGGVVATLELHEIRSDKVILGEGGRAIKLKNFLNPARKGVHAFTDEADRGYEWRSVWTGLHHQYELFSVQGGMDTAPIATAQKNKVSHAGQAAATATGAGTHMHGTHHGAGMGTTGTGMGTGMGGATGAGMGTGMAGTTGTGMGGATGAGMGTGMGHTGAGMGAGMGSATGTGMGAGMGHTGTGMGHTGTGMGTGVGTGMGATGTGMGGPGMTSMSPSSTTATTGHGAHIPAATTQPVGTMNPMNPPEAMAHATLVLSPRAEEVRDLVVVSYMFMDHANRPNALEG